MNTWITTAALAALALTTSACGDGDDVPAPAGNGMALPDVSRQRSTAPGHEINAGTMRDRQLIGTWRGTSGDTQTEASFGDGGGLSVRVMRGTSMVDAASGKWRWNDDGTLQGTLTGGMATLGGYSVWSAAFPTPGHMAIAGPGGTLAVERVGGVLGGKDPAAVQGEAK